MAADAAPIASGAIDPGANVERALVMGMLRAAEGRGRRALSEEAVIAQALAILARRIDRSDAPVFFSPDCVKAFLTLHLAGLEHEVFALIYLNTRHRVIAFEPMFRGTLGQASVYPREVVKRALHHNAAAVILAHNHPSGVPEPSRDDLVLTETLKSALRLVDVRVIDHLIVGGMKVVSFAERGLMC